MNSTGDDTQLLGAWHHYRNAEAFRILCERYAGLIAGCCRRQGSPDPTEAVQAVFLVLARRAGSVPATSQAGRPQAEVAAELGCSVAAVKMRVLEGLDRMRAFYARKGISLSAVALGSGLASEATACDPTLTPPVSRPSKPPLLRQARRLSPKES